MDDNINGVGSAAEMPETDAAAIDEPIVDGGSGTEDGEPKKPLKLDYAQTFKVGFAFAIIMIFWTAYDFVVPLLLEHAYGLSNTVRGLIMGLDNLLSLFMLPLFGKISDNAKGKLVKKWGRRTPFIVIGTIASVILMVFVPVSTLGQQEKAMDIENDIRAQLDEDEFMTEHLTEFWEKGGNYADRDYMAINEIDKEQFLAIRYDGKFTATKAFLGMLGATTYKYDGVEVSLDAEVDLAKLGYTLHDWNGDGARTYDDIRISNENYEKFAATGMNTWISDQIYDQATNTAEGHKSIAIYMVILLLVLIAMATFRSPAVALMPDVTPKPLRSQGNAVINLCGGVGGAIAFLIYTVVLFGERLENYVIIFASVAAGMLLLLAGFLAFVREKKMVDRCHEICKEYGIADEDEAAAERAEDAAAAGENVLADESAASEKADISPEVLEAAGTKWNFLPFRPGLVGGHCIGVDPYYLIHGAWSYNVYPRLIMEARVINENMAYFVSGVLTKNMMNRRVHVVDSRILILGFAFKANCPDTRNTKVEDVYSCLRRVTDHVSVYDPVVRPEEVAQRYRIHLLDNLEEHKGEFDAIILCVAHKEFLSIPLRPLLKEHGILFDAMNVLPDTDYYL